MSQLNISIVDDRGLNEQDANITIDHSLLSLNVQALPGKIKHDTIARGTPASVTKKGIDGHRMVVASRLSPGKSQLNR